jgi:hypothetical protein
MLQRSWVGSVSWLGKYILRKIYGNSYALDFLREDMMLI